MTRLQAGFSALDITPSPPSDGPLAGYAGRGRAVGVLDPIWVRALALQSGEVAVVLIAIDACAIAAGNADRISARVGDALGIPHEAVLVAVTHTHASYAVTDTEIPGLVGPADQDSVARCESNAVAAATAAWRDLRPVEATYTKFGLDGIAANRRDPSQPIQPGLAVRLAPGSGPGIDVLVLGTHPTVLGGDNRCYSGDLSGAVVRAAERRWGGRALVLTGAAGDVSTRFTRQGRDSAEADRLATLTIDRVGQMLPTATPLDATLAVATTEVTLPGRPRPEPTQIASWRSALLEQAAPTAEVGHRIAEDLGGLAMMAELPLGADLSARLAALRIGGLGMGFIPGEPVTALAASIEALAPDLQVVGYTGGYLGYLVSDDAGPGYERFISRAGTGTEAVLVDAFAELFSPPDI